MYLLGTEFAKLTRPWKAGKPMEVFTCVSMGMSLDPTQTISLNTRQWRLDWKTKMKEKKHLNENNELFVTCGRKLDLPLFCHYPFKLLNHNWNYHLLLCNFHVSFGFILSALFIWSYFCVSIPLTPFSQSKHSILGILHSFCPLCNSSPSDKNLGRRHKAPQICFIKWRLNSL